MITELFRFSDDEIIIKMKYSDLRNLGDEIYDLLHHYDSQDAYNYCEQLLDVIRKGNDKYESN